MTKNHTNSDLFVSLTNKTWFNVQNRFTEAVFTHISPQNINVLTYKFLLCAICGWQQRKHVEEFTSELWNPHEQSCNADIPELVSNEFICVDQRSVILSFEEISQYCTVSKKKHRVVKHTIRASIQKRLGKQH